MQENYVQMVIFYHVVELKSFSKAAERLSLSKAHVSKQISQLEKSMQTKLLERTTRKLALTFAGEQLYQHCRNIVLEYHNAEQTIAALQGTPQGLLRVTAPPAFAAHVLAEALPAFLQSYPDIQLDLALTSEILDLMEEKIDVAIRLTHTPPEDRVAKLIGHYQLQICASKEYCENNALPKQPHELAKHPCLSYFGSKWPFRLDDQEINVDVASRLMSNTYQVIQQAAREGCGIAMLPSYVIKDDVEKGDLNVLFVDQMQAKIPIYAVYTQNVFMPPMIKVFIEFLLTLKI